MLVFSAGAVLLSAQATGPLPVAALNPAKLDVQPKRVTDRKPNPKGRVLVLMYHRIGPEEKYMVRSKDNFLRDLNRLHKMGFRPVTVTEYATNTMKLAPGASPVILTFDDSWEEQFRILPDGRIDPECFVGLWKKFAEAFPDFPIKATWYCLGNGPFIQKESAAKKLAMLTEWGGEIASHTMRHSNLAKVSASKVVREIGESYRYLRALGYTPKAFAPPYGVFPKDRRLTKGFKYKGEVIKFSSWVQAGSGPGLSPNHERFNPLNIPRIQAYPGHMGVVYWLNRVSNGKLDIYVAP